MASGYVILSCIEGDKHMRKNLFSLALVAGAVCLGDVSAAEPMDRLNVEIDTRFVEAGRVTLEAVGYFDTNRVDAAVLYEQLLARQDAKLLESVRVVTHSGENAVDKHVVEYIYPTEYTVRLSTNAVAATNAEAALSAVVEPKSFTMREVGPIVDVTPTLADDGKLIDLSFRAQLEGEPEWKKYGAKAKGEGAATCARATRTSSSLSSSRPV